ncbi:MAG: CBS domain-containing protein [Novosphingobium sp.]|nr:CBS domain-containing protein [Novosphingobium sp.]
MKIARILEQRDGTVHTCSAADGVAKAAGLLAEHRIGALPVMDGGEVVGIFSERDLLYCVAKEGAAALERTVGDVMTSPPITVERDTDVMEALSLMTRRRIRHLPVVEGRRMIGLISIGDLVKVRVELAESEAEAMREYIQTA